MARRHNLSCCFALPRLEYLFTTISISVKSSLCLGYPRQMRTIQNSMAHHVITDIYNLASLEEVALPSSFPRHRDKHRPINWRLSSSAFKHRDDTNPQSANGCEWARDHQLTQPFPVDAYIFTRDQRNMVNAHLPHPAKENNSSSNMCASLQSREGAYRTVYSEGPNNGPVRSHIQIIPRTTQLHSRFFSLPTRCCFDQLPLHNLFWKTLRIGNSRVKIATFISNNGPAIETSFSPQLLTS
ncbi:hypothetical protein B0J14DRAFT_206066 [Halenospora varia]|nr:hypothetical protein B0J14DRAFT_206066 [Halenospora varia]